ncbi:MAG: hydrogenase, partial [Byssovorax sp.]
MAPVWTRPGLGWWLLFFPCVGLTGLLGLAVYVTLTVGIGSWGNNIPVAWAFGITNFVWWIGIGHAGTLISAVLLLFQARWRTSINRFAEAMTLFAVV